MENIENSNNHVINSNLPVVKVLGELPTGRQGHEYIPGGEGRCAFAPDESRFAWYCGFRKIILVPWNRYKNCLRDLKIKQSQDNSDDIGADIDTEQITIECGFKVCSLAFGTGTPEDELLPEKKNFWMRFSDTQNLMFATGHTNGRIRVWDPQTGQLLLELTDHKYAVNSLAFAPDGTLRLVSCSEDGTIKIWDLADDGNLVKTLSDSHKSAFKKITWSPDARLLCVVGQKQKVLVWDMQNYKLYQRLTGHFNEVLSASFSPDGAMLATASRDTRVIIWDVSTGSILRTLHHVNPPPGLIYMSGANDHYVTGVSFAPNGCQIVTSCSDGILRFWDLTSDDKEAQAIGNGIQDDGMLSCCYSPLGGTVAVSFTSGSAVFYASQPKVPSLLHISRMAVRKSVDAKSLHGLFIPRTLVPYVAYKEW